jgi:hypothetical protein
VRPSALAHRHHPGQLFRRDWSPRPPRTRGAVVRDVALQILLLGALLVLYRLGRTVADGNVGEATSNASSLHQWERSLGLPDELSLQRWFLARPDVAKAANLYYATVHFPLTALALLWLYLRNPSTYAWMRTVIVSMTAIALVLTFLVPLTPPRLMPDLGFTDVAMQFGQSVYGGVGNGNANQYAAMPSLHVGWALLVAIALVRAGHTRWRWLWLLHPVLTLLVVVGTANHYWLDAGAAVALLGLCVAISALVPALLRRQVPSRLRHVVPQVLASRRVIWLPHPSGPPPGHEALPHGIVPASRDPRLSTTSLD